MLAGLAVQAIASCGASRMFHVEHLFMPITMNVKSDLRGIWDFAVHVSAGREIGGLAAERLSS